jgi:hypothetical protein
MTSAKGGRPQKGAAITEGYNARKTYRGTASDRKLRAERAAKRKALAASLAARKAEPTAPLTLDDIDNWGAPAEDTKELPPPVGAATESGRTDANGTGSFSAGEAGLEAARGHKEEDEEDDQFAEGLMRDMRWVYKQLRGREKLKELMGNDKEFLVLVKELMKLEAAYLQNKLKKKEGTVGGAGGFLVVLKGLEGDNKLVADMKKDKTIDLKQIERALNPTSNLLGPADEEDNQTEAPTTIIRKGLTLEQEEELQEGVKLAEEDW